MKTTSSTSQLVVRDLCVKVEEKALLHDVNIVAESGDLLAIMGPSGSGKTTLLNALSGRIQRSSGEITLNGFDFSKQNGSRLGYVLQEGVFMSRLTLYETLYFTAMIHTPESIPLHYKNKRIQEIADALDMKKCLNTVIGDMFHRGLSGGEKKRANIACELLIDPDIMLIDEPTSGLDSSTAKSLMLQLRNYATDYNKTIIATIHQPSSEVFHLFSTLLLLMEGHVVYFGKAKEVLNYFESIGFTCAIHFNPADFILSLVKSDELTRDTILMASDPEGQLEKMIHRDAATIEQYDRNSQLTTELSDTKMASFEQNKLDSTNFLFYTSSVDIDTDDKSSTSQHKWPTSFWTQYRMLTWRHMKQSRGHILNVFDVAHALFIALIGGILYFQTELSYNTLRDRMGLIYFCGTFWGFNIILTTVSSFSEERGVIQKERNGRAYRLSAYYFAKMTTDLPLILLIPVIFLCVVYWMAGMGDLSLFFIFAGVNLLHCLLCQSIGHLLGASVWNMRTCITIGSTYMVFSLMLSGFLNVNVPTWFQWAKYFSVIHYTFASMSILSTQDLPVLWCNTTSPVMFPLCNGYTAYITKNEVLKDYGIDNPYFCYIASMGILLVVLRILGYCVLRWKR